HGIERINGLRRLAFPAHDIAIRLVQNEQLRGGIDFLPAVGSAEQVLDSEKRRTPKRPPDLVGEVLLQIGDRALVVEYDGDVMEFMAESIHDIVGYLSQESGHSGVFLSFYKLVVHKIIQIATDHRISPIQKIVSVFTDLAQVLGGCNPLSGFEVNDERFRVVG